MTFDHPTPAALARFIAGQGGSPPSDALPAAKQLAPADLAPSAVSEAAAAAQAARSYPADVAADVASIVASVIGSEVAPDEPLMAAGLDSLGPSPPFNAEACNAAAFTGMGMLCSR